MHRRWIYINAKCTHVQKVCYTKARRSPSKKEIKQGGEWKDIEETTMQQQ